MGSISVISSSQKSHLMLLYHLHCSVKHKHLKHFHTFTYFTQFSPLCSTPALMAHWAQSFEARQHYGEMRQSPKGRWREVSWRSRWGPRPDWFFKWTQNCVCICVYYILVWGINTALSSITSHSFLIHRTSQSTLCIHWLYDWFFFFFNCHIETWNWK